ncbi:basic secretory protein-like protein [Mucilaginibacter pocheonensis]|uniref:Effector-binding domain-containing protein n=1 Tax=Mucilaginibacter pocheonensis TaxID=398050 RepID=A0ABU1T817_9SPHI|nr:basic secretory protein-like protein [Mucilaginibacter pocheonensis]MDR6940950.1 effector-binding domain-containing protein [Mucilaginibacter pocheonensis]
MKKTFLLSLLFAFALAENSHAQSSEVFKKSGYKLTFENQDTTFSKELKDKLVETFYEVYPKLAKEYNKKTSRNVTFVIDTTYDGVAATSDDRVVFSAKYMTSHPKDIDVVTHEVMHIVQAYKESNGPGWLTEGIADYARFKFGVDNAGAKWALPAFKTSQSYENSYRVTARFLFWIEKNIKPGLVKDFDSQLRDHTFTDNSWKNATGKTLDELWSAYSANPAV